MKTDRGRYLWGWVFGALTSFILCTVFGLVVYRNSFLNRTYADVRIDIKSMGLWPLPELPLWEPGRFEWELLTCAIPGRRGRCSFGIGPGPTCPREDASSLLKGFCPQPTEDLDVSGPKRFSSVSQQKPVEVSVRRLNE
mmetsp:Transcript_29468/g.114006  ORF Transcript_29468/g.114006 Transcript_29468/m.114006 type:complete len:139 (-) Transcript_29468:115-531(-)